MLNFPSEHGCVLGEFNIHFPFPDSEKECYMKCSHMFECRGMAREFTVSHSFFLQTAGSREKTIFGETVFYE